jgi:hypothetical protein
MLAYLRCAVEFSVGYLMELGRYHFPEHASIWKAKIRKIVCRKKGFAGGISTWDGVQISRRSKLDQSVYKAWPLKPSCQLRSAPKINSAKKVRAQVSIAIISTNRYNQSFIYLLSFLDGAPHRRS